MTDLRKAAEMALEALMEKGEHHPKVYGAAEALRQALAQPPCQTGSQCIGGKCPECEREWVGLTNDEMSELANKYKYIETGWYHDMALIAEAEAKLKEKNT